MARKKEIDLDVRNRARIAEIAKKLFLKYGYEKTLINDIAKEADMSKSTLYVYFKNKEEIRDYISLEAMQYFYDALKQNIRPELMDLHAKYREVCRTLVDFRGKYPLSFQLIVEEIRVDDEALKTNEVLARIYEVGESINQFIYGCLQEGFTDGQGNEEKLRNDGADAASLQIMEQWGCMYGLITLAENKKAYLYKDYGVTKEDFLERGFENLYQNFVKTMKPC